MGSSRGTDDWRRLPERLPEECAHLVAELRQLKDRSHLSLAELAEDTAISRSSWDRYLNGKQFPPRHAVQALCRAAQENHDEILAQWELADAAWSGRGHTIPPHPGQTSPKAVAAEAVTPDGPPSPQPGGLPRRVLVATSDLITTRPKTSAASVLLLCAAMVTSAAIIHASRTTTPVSATRAPICQLRSCEGRNPRTTACEDPTTLASHTAADGTRLEIRLSPSCRAGWLRTWPTHPGFRIEITGSGAHPQTAVRTTRPADQEAITTTTMIAAPRPASLRACYYPASNQPGRECFGDAG